MSRTSSSPLSSFSSSFSSSPREPIAIVGIGCRFPCDSNTVNEYWKNLLSGRSGIRKVPSERFQVERYLDTGYTNKRGTVTSDKGGYIRDVEMFDAEFFNIGSLQASTMDPQQRVLLEVSYEALEDAGIRVESLNGSSTSVFAGVFLSDYVAIQTDPEARYNINQHTAMGSSTCSLANRVSYAFNLKGPSITLDTACSGSLVAISQACDSIWSGSATAAIAGGVNLLLKAESSIVMSKAGFLSPDGYCQSFSANANGYARGEGCGMVVLKPLSAAQRDGNQIYAVVKGIACNSDGFTPEGLTVPNPHSQAALIQQVFQQAQVNGREVSYVEAHGTGTKLGDPLEVKSIGHTIGQYHNEANPLVIGSVKATIGHLEGAAGVAAFIKTALVLKHGMVPKNLNALPLHPDIPFKKFNLIVPLENINLRELNQNPSQRLHASVNSFGAGGTNAHAVLAEYPSRQQSNNALEPEGKQTASPSDVSLFFLSAKSVSALDDLVKAYLDYFPIINSQDFRSICYSLFQHRNAFKYRLMITSSSVNELVELLSLYLKNVKHAQIVSYQHDDLSLNLNPYSGLDQRMLDESSDATSVAIEPKSSKLAFVFSGQGGQWIGMGRHLLQSSEPFRDALQRIDEEFKLLADWSIIEKLTGNSSPSEFDRTSVAQPLIMAIQIGLHSEWLAAGFQPDGYCGHSIGEVAAAYCAGAIDLKQAVQCIYKRSTIQQTLEGRGKMLATGITEQQAIQLIAEQQLKHGRSVEIAAINGPLILALVGEVDLLEEIGSHLDAKGIFQKFVNVAVPYHSKFMEEIKDELIKELSTVQGQSLPDTRQLYSTVSGQRENGSHITGQYWYENIRQPVYFKKAVESMLADGYTQFIEIGPHPVLIPGVIQRLEQLPNYQQHSNQYFATHSTLRNRAEKHELMHNIGKLALYRRRLQIVQDHNNVDPTQSLSPSSCRPSIHPNILHYLFGNSNFEYTPGLPLYRWQHKPYWNELEPNRELRLGKFHHPFLRHYNSLVSSSQVGQSIWQFEVHASYFPYLADHLVDGTIVFPATAYMELCFAVLKHIQMERYHIKLQQQHPLVLKEFHFESAFVVPNDDKGPTFVRLELLSDDGEFNVFSRTQGSTLTPLLKTTSPSSSTSSHSNSASGGSWTKHASGVLQMLTAEQPVTLLDESLPLTLNCRDSILPSFSRIQQFFESIPKEDVEEFYSHVKKTGLTYGKFFQNIKSMQYHPLGLLFGEIEFSNRAEATSYHLHPALFDAAAHLGFLHVFKQYDHGKLYLPHSTGQVKLYKQGVTRVYSCIQCTQYDLDYASFNVVLFDMDGEIVCQVDNFLLKYMLLQKTNSRLDIYENCVQSQWIESKLDEENSTALSDYDLKDGVIFYDIEQHRNVVQKLQQQLRNQHKLARIHLIDIQSLLTSLTNSTDLSSSDTHQQLRQQFASLFESKNILLDKRTHVFFLPGANQNLHQLAKMLNTELDDNSSIIDELESCSGSIQSLALFLFDFIRFIVDREGVIRLYLIFKSQSCPTPSYDQQLVLPLDHGQFFGFSRVLAQEYPNIPFKMIAFNYNHDESEDVENVATLIIDELYRWKDECREREIYYPTVSSSSTANVRPIRLIRQLYRFSQEYEKLHYTTPLPSSGGDYYTTKLDGSTSIDAIEFIRNIESTYSTSAGLKDDEVMIDVEAAGCNFKDVVNIAGLLNKKATDGGLAGHRLGLEIAGRITGKGRLVTEYQINDEVMARVSDGFSGKVRTAVHNVALKPPHLTMTEAASIPVVYVTVIYGLDYLARLTSSDTVLIHSAAGGVGIAAIKYAQLIGAKIIATCGSASKRSWLQTEFGLEHIFDSRSDDFYSKVMNVTNHRGVDVVLNSLTGSGLMQSTRCLAPFGRFIEIGKTDIYQDKALPLERLAENCSYFIVDVDRMPRDRPQLHASIMKRISELFTSQQLTQHPIHRFDVEQIRTGLQSLMRGNLIGKCVIDMKSESTVSALPPQDYQYRSDRSYLITGGCSGLGFELAKHLHSKGAKHLILVSRGGFKNEADQTACDQLVKSGCTVHLEMLDISDPHSTLSLFKRIHCNTGKYKSLAGIIHSAGALKDLVIPKLTPETFLEVLQPKSIGALNLHVASRMYGLSLDFFVLISSIACILGFSAQLSYCTANCFLDNLSAYRKHYLNSTSLSLNVGLLGEFAGFSRTFGLTAEEFRFRTILSATLRGQGVMTMPLYDVLNKFDLSLCHSQFISHRAIARIDYKLYTKHISQLSLDALYQKVIESNETKSQRSRGLKDQCILAASEDKSKAIAILLQNLQSLFCRLLGQSSTSQLDLNQSIDQFGVDSLVLNQVRSWISDGFAFTYPMMKLLKGPTISSIAEDIFTTIMESTGGNSTMSTSSATLGSAGARTSNKQTNNEYKDLHIINDWLVSGKHILPYGQSDSKSTVVFCFPSLGASALLFTQFLLQQTDENVEFIAIDYPGRGHNSSGPVLNDFHVLIEQLAQVIIPFLDRPYVFLSHSFGSIVAYEVAREFDRLNQIRYITPQRVIPSPKYFLPAGTIAPHLLRIWKQRDSMRYVVSENHSVEMIVALSRYVEDPQYLLSLLPAIRQDWPLLLSYKNDHRRTGTYQFSCPIVAYSAVHDEIAYKEEIEEWQSYTTSTFELIQVPGDHWFINKNASKMIKKVCEMSQKLQRNNRECCSIVEISPTEIELGTSTSG